MMQVNNGVALPIIPDIRIADDQKSIIKPVEEGEYPFPSIKLKYLMNLEKKIQTRFGVVLDYIKNGVDPEDMAREVNPVVQKIRKKSWFSHLVTTPIANLATYGFIGIGKYAGKKIAAEKFIDAVITDMDERGLLEKDHWEIWISKIWE